MPVINCKCGELYVFEDYYAVSTFWCEKCAEYIQIASGGPARRNAFNFRMVALVTGIAAIGGLMILLTMFALRTGKSSQAKKRALSGSAVSNTGPTSESPSKRTSTGGPVAGSSRSGLGQTETFVMPAIVPLGGAERASLYLGAEPLGEGIREGLSSLTVENKTDMDSLVRVLRQVGEQMVRNFYIPAGESYKAEGIPSGKHFLRVDYGRIWNRSEQGFSPTLFSSDTKRFDITERTTGNGTSYSQMTITLKIVTGPAAPPERVYQTLPELRRF